MIGLDGQTATCDQRSVGVEVQGAVAGIGRGAVWLGDLEKAVALEGSNVDMTESMVQTMNLVRAYEANQKLLQMQDETLKSTVNDVGKAS